MNRFDLTGRVCVVTGGGRGIGRAIAGAFAESGAEVVIAGRNAATLEAAAAEMTAAGGRVQAMVADVSREEDVTRLAEQVSERLGPAHVLVNNAGINPIYKAAEATGLSEWQEILATNLTGVFLACREFGKAMLAQGRGSIVTISSIGGHVGLAKTAPYCAAKGGVELLTKSLALDWAKRGVRVNTIAPAYVETDLTHGLQEHEVLGARIRGRTPLGRFATADEICGAALFLASDASSYVTGQSIRVDGGWTAA